MTLPEMYEDATAYFHTREHFHGMLDNLTVLAIDVILLSITVPIMLHVRERVRTRRRRFMFDFYLFQIFHRITRMFLKIASVEDINPILDAEGERNPNFFGGSHYIYGNLEGILFALNQAFKNRPTLREAIESKGIADLEAYLANTNRCLDEF